MRAKAPLPFAAWEPDRAMISGSASEAKGVIALTGRYAPDKSFLPLKPGAALNSRGLGGAGFYQNGVTARVFAADSGRIYEVVARVPVDVSKIGGYAANPDWPWSFEQFGGNIIATARGLPQVQHFQLGSSAQFADLATGPGASDGLFRIREFLFSGKDFTIKNSAFNNYTDWVPDSGTQAGTFELPHDGGLFVKGVSGQFALIFQERKIHRLVYQGGAAPFHRDEIETKRGALGPGAVCSFGSMTFFVSEDGFRVTDGNSSEPIGNAKVDRYFASRLNYAYRARVSMAFDPEKKVLRTIFPSGGSSTADEMLLYSLDSGQWTHDDCDVDWLIEAPRPGININDDAAIANVAGSSIIDNVNIPVDSSVWRESRNQVMAVGKTGELGTYEGPNRPASIETGYGEVLPGRKGFASEIWPLTDAPVCTATITSKLSNLADSASQTAISSLNEHGFCPVLVEARWMKVGIQVPYATVWSEASGIDWDARAAGEL